MVNGVLNRTKAVNFIRNVYKRPVQTGIFLNDNGIPLKTVPQVVFILSLMPNNPKELFKLIITALSSPDIRPIEKRRLDLDTSTKAANKESDFIETEGTSANALPASPID